MFNKRKNSESQRQSQKNTTYSGVSVLRNNENGLKFYNSRIVKMIHRAFEPLEKNSKILEFGAGTGTLAIEFKRKFDISPDCIEIDSELLSILKARGFVTYSDLEKSSAKYLYIYSSNVIEHIEDDFAAIKELADRLAVKGKIAFYVPAFQFLFSELDTNVGHFRRYGKNELISKVQKSGLNVTSCYYSDSLGFFATLIVKLIGFNTDSGLGSTGALKFYDRICYPISIILDSLGLKFILGKNLFLVAEKKYED